MANGTIDLNHVLEDGGTVMHFAGRAYYYWPQLFNMFKELGGKTDIPNSEGKTANVLAEESMQNYQNMRQDSYNYVNTSFYC